MKMMPPDVISHENQLQHLSHPSIFILDVFRTADHAGQIFIPHRPATSPDVARDVQQEKRLFQNRRPIQWITKVAHLIS